MGLLKSLLITFMVIIVFSCKPYTPVNLDPDSETFHQSAKHFFTKDEIKIFKTLQSKDGRKKFINSFWEIRDPNPETQENEFKTEIEKWVAYRRP
jgi:hypothetical protein